MKLVRRRESEELIRGSTILDNTVLALWTPRANTQFLSPGDQGMGLQGGEEKGCRS